MAYMRLASVEEAVEGGACGCRRDQCCTCSSQLVDLRKAYGIIVAYIALKFGKKTRV